MNNDVDIKRVLFIDIETVPVKEFYSDLDEDYKQLWDQKHQFIRKAEDQSPGESFEGRAGIYSEFGKIICICVGFLVEEKEGLVLRQKAFSGDNEKALLQSFLMLLERSFPNSIEFALCGHNIKEFDVPYICRRSLINGLKLPDILQLHGKKPWEVNHLDTMQLWRFGDYKNYTSLDLMAKILNIPSPKQDMSGADVSGVYYKEKDLPKIVAYCHRDVETVARLYLKFSENDSLARSVVVNN